MNKIIEVSGLKKSYGKVEAVKGIDFYVEEGKLFAFLGPNGAGKSTTVDMICAFLKPDSGEVMIDGLRLGHDDTEIRRIIGAVFQDGLLDPLLTVGENLRARGSFYGLRGVALTAVVKKTAEDAGITALLRRPYGKLSGGQRRRCDIARALVNAPKILFLDEPTTGLDPQTRLAVWNMINDIRIKTGMTVFLTTHYMEEAAVADYVMLIDSGKISAKGTPSELKEKYSNDRVILTCSDLAAVCAGLDESKTPYEVVADTVTVSVPATMDALPVIERFKDKISSFEVKKGTMDDAFIAITGKEMRE